MCITFKLQDSKRKRDFRHSNDPMARIKIPNSYGTSTRHTKAYRRVSFVSSEKCRKSSSDKSYMAENVIVRPSYDPLVPNWKFRILTGHLQYMPNHFLGYQLCTPENLDVVQVTNFTGENNRRLSTIIWPLGITWNFQNFIAHLQDIPNHRVSFIYSMKCW